MKFIAGFLLVLTLATGAGAAIPSSATSSPELHARAAAALARTDLVSYRGWLKFLQFEADRAAEKNTPDRDAKSQRLSEWIDRINADPHTLDQLTGVQEWAYESPADGSGQPFKFVVPSDYVRGKPAGLSVYMHGYSGNHMEHSTGFAPQPGIFQIAVLGRSRGGGYRALSEADVLHVIDYMQAHWDIDPSRIHLNGGSMGGGGTYRLGSRYPHRWASARPTCGYASFVPFRNLLTLPIYATHSDDDYVVSALHERGPLARLRSAGGNVIYDETTGLGHAAWDYAAGNARGAEWVAQQTRPDPRTIRHIDYTALDGGAMRGWWAEIAEWGAAPRPARFVIAVGAANTVHAELTNIARLQLRLDESPLDRDAPLHVSVNGGVPITLAAPLPERVIIARHESAWEFEPKTPVLPFRLHTPGSSTLLYQGEPLLIVFGTGGTPEENSAMKNAALAASKSPFAGWLDDSGEAGPDGVPHSQNLYGWLPTKADRDITPADMERCHLVLIGSAAQNAVVARIAGRLPVRIEGDQLVTSDRQTYPFSHHTLGLVHYNPLAPDRLVFWVAGSNAAAYRADAAVPAVMGGGDRFAGAQFGGDFLLMESAQPRLVVARGFDSRWEWDRREARSPVLPKTIETQLDLSTEIATAINRAADADACIVAPLGGLLDPAVENGVTRAADVAAFFFHLPIGIVNLSGAELAAFSEAGRKDPAAPLLVFLRAGKPATIETSQRYRVALPVNLLWGFARIARTAPAGYEITDLTVDEAIERHLGR